MKSRFLTRARIVSAAMTGVLSRRRLEGAPARVLIAHHPKMIGDTLLLAPLAAKARHLWPQAEIVMTASPATQPLYATRPWNVDVHAFDPANAATLNGFRRRGGYDLAIVPGDNRYGWFARALGARWVVGFDGDRPPYKNLLLDERHRYPDTPGTWADLAAGLIAGTEAPAYQPSQWPAPPHRPFERPAGPYAVIHLGASSVLKQWLPERWSAVAGHLESRGLQVVWSAGRGEEALVAEVDPRGVRKSYAGTLDLAQVRHLLAGAKAFVTPDTGLSHLARFSFTPTVTLFGPGTPQLMGNGRFFRDAPWKAVIVDPWHCRDQRLLYKREVQWVRRCARSSLECATPTCMHAIEVRRVIEALGELDAGLA
jgi:ADP-heptose:LPS heptosyltransferase